MYLKCTDGRAHQRKLLALDTSCHQVCHCVLKRYLVACFLLVIDEKNVEVHAQHCM